jgi:hypothetical protein
MNKPLWKNEPEWADRLMKSVDGEYFWCDVEKYLLAGGKFFARKFGEENSFTMGEFELIEMRSDPWKEGEERMKAIGPNGNEGEHYDKVDDSLMSVDGYECLKDVLVRAYDQASKGKGDERHAQGAAFENQPMQKIIELYGVGFALGQSAKKAQESMRLTKDRAIAELLGGINYLAGAIINMEKKD